MRSKIIFLASVLLSVSVVTAQNVELELREGENVSSFLRRTFSGIPQVYVPHGILYNRVQGWSRLIDWNSGDTTSTSHIKQSWYDLEQAQNFLLVHILHIFESNSNLNTFKS